MVEAASRTEASEAHRLWVGGRETFSAEVAVDAVVAETGDRATPSWLLMVTAAVPTVVVVLVVMVVVLVAWRRLVSVLELLTRWTQWPLLGNLIFVQPALGLELGLELTEALAQLELQAAVEPRSWLGPELDPEPYLELDPELDLEL